VVSDDLIQGCAGVIGGDPERAERCVRDGGKIADAVFQAHVSLLYYEGQAILEGSDCRRLKVGLGRLSGVGGE
jgi:hypothetical protein